MSEQATTRIGVIGTGYLGRLHARVLTEMPEVSVAGFVDHNDEHAGEVVEKLGLRRFATVAELAAEIDCAVVATPTTSHFEISSELLEAGCDVMIEKPVTSNPEDAEQLIQLASSRGRLIQVGHVERYNPAVMAVVPLLGQARYVEAERLGVFVGRSLDVDVLLDLMIHDLHLILSLVGTNVVDLKAVGVPVLTDRVDIANVRLELDNGAVANLTASRVSDERVRKFRIFSSDSYISIDLKEQQVKGYRLEKAAARSLIPLEVEVQKKEPLRAELESFVQSVQTRTRPLVSAEDGLAALRLAIRVGAAIEDSLRMNARH